eukprot:TRINITY_DN2031_c0_g5_i1.p1 TRINITY_DN2031_c0_g5~~TRINITY_DN2031_c0_g5_i1.p1  ORF type:complete len:753 (-),score=-40.38 TRINITY_DN2031_c0_g5_i1:28-2076(-)
MHPIVAFVSADSDDFKAYTGGYFVGACGSSINHAVLIVGYGVDAVSGPYWIVKNSWGAQWGEQGFMKLAMADGAGRCGVNEIAPIYPLYYPASPPSSMFPVGPLASTPLYTPIAPYWASGFTPAANANPCASKINPCGGGTCSVDKKGWARCKCPKGFVERIDAPTPKCVPQSPCAVGTGGSGFNPCGAGKCGDVAGAGLYTCACSDGYVIGSHVDGSPTCVSAAAAVGGGPTYTAVHGDTCSAVSARFGISIDALTKVNSFLDCSKPIPAGVIVVISDPTAAPVADTACASTAYVLPGETCKTLAARLFRGSQPALVAANPGLACNRLYGYQQVCARLVTVKQAVVAGATGACGLTYVAVGGESCTVVAKTFGLTSKQFTGLNPSLVCTVPLAVDTSVCVASQASQPSFDCTQWHFVQQGDSCASVANAAGLSLVAFQGINPAIRCEPQQLFIGQQVCVASPRAADVDARSAKTATVLKSYTVQAGDTLPTIAMAFFDTCGTSSGEPAICAANGIWPCSSSALAVGRVLAVPCAPKQRVCPCSTSVMVCGADYNTYPSYCEAVCNYATPATQGPCTPCQQACNRRTGLPADPRFQLACPLNLNTTFCSFPSWPPADIESVGFSDPCLFEQETCADACADTAGKLVDPLVNEAQWAVYRDQCVAQCMCTPRVSCGNDQCAGS